MAVTKGSVADALAGYLITDTDADSTAESNVTGTTSGTLYCVYGDATSCTVDTYIKVADNSSATSSSTVPDFVFYVPAASAVSYIAVNGHAWSSGVSFWGTSTVANAATQTDPAADVTVRILTA
jgi:mannose-1-phosphate guanylyltransferase